MDDQKPVQVFCMWCHSLVATLTREELKLNTEFYCPTCQHTIYLKSIVNNFGGNLTSLN